MAGRRKAVEDVREIIRRLQMGQRIKEIRRDLKLARNTVRKYMHLATKEGWFQGALPSAAAIEAALERRPRAVTESKALAFEGRIRELRDKGVEAQAIFQFLAKEGFGGSYSSVKRFVRKLEAKAPEAVLRMEVEAGAEAQVDFGAGPLLVNAATGECRKSWVFVMTLGHSRHQYVELVLDQKMATWLGCHQRAFEFWGGVPKRVVLDNLAAAITKACFHDPVVTTAYRHFAEHYGFLIAPCRPRTPQHKGKVESGVHYAKRNALAGQELGWELGPWNEHLRRWCLEVAGVRMHGTTQERPLERFEKVEKGSLLPLPPDRYEVYEPKQAKLHSDCHVVFEKSFYSAPHRFIGQELLVKAFVGRVELYFQHERVATHARAVRRGQRLILHDHYPPEKLAGLLAAPTRLREQAKGIGEATFQLIDQLLRDRPVDRLRACMGIVRLAGKYGESRLEAACARALNYDNLGYGIIKRILHLGLDLTPSQEELFTQGPVPKTAAYARPLSDLAAHFHRSKTWNWSDNSAQN